MAIEKRPSKNVIVSNWEETVSVHNNLAGTLNLNLMYKENASDKPKNNTPEIIHDFSTDHIDAVDRNTITEDNINIQKNISHSIPDNSQLIDFVVCDNMGNNSTNSNNNDWLFNDM